MAQATAGASLIGRRVEASTQAHGLGLRARLGFWSAILTAACPVAFLVLNLPVPSQNWHGMDAYIRSFDQTQMLWTIPTLILAPTFVVLIACIHAQVPVDKRLLAQLGLVFAVIYATLESANYTIQLMVVRPSILSGRGQDLAIFAMTNPNGLFAALELLGYVLQVVGILFVALAFRDGRLEQSIRWSLIGVVFGAVPLAVILAWLVPPARTLGFATVSTDLWAVFLFVAAVLLGIFFRRQGRIAEVS
jgi:hypothetical protein